MAARGRHLPPLPPHHRGPQPPRRRLRGAAQSGPLRCRRPPLGQGAARSRGGETTLREVGRSGFWVSAHPDVILKMGTKEVLFRTRDVGWGADTDLYETF